MNTELKEIKAFTLNLSDIYKLIIDNINLIVSIIMLICGIIIGSHAVCVNNDFSDIISFIFSFTDSFFIELFRSLLFCLLLLTINFILGLSCVGFPIISVNVSFSGFFIGCFITSSFLDYYESSSISSIFCRILTAVILCVIVLYSAEISCRQTSKISANLLNYTKLSCLNIREYLLKYLCLLLLCFFEAIISGLLLSK